MPERQTRHQFLRTSLGVAALSAVGTESVFAAKGGAAPASDELARLYDAAKKEGTLTWWTSHYSQDTAEAARDAFKAKYPGIEVQFIRQTAQVINQRLTQNIKAGIHEVDVFASADEAHYPALKKQGVLATYLPPDAGHAPAAFRQLDPDNQYQLGAIGFVIMDYNTKAIANPPKMWTGLLDPRWKGQVTVGHPGFSAYIGSWAVTMNDKYGWDYFKRLEANQPKIGRSSLDAIADIIAGERLIGTGQDAYAYAKHAEGNAIGVEFPQDDAILMVGPVAIPKDAPHPNAGRLFVNFYYSPEYSRAMVRTFNFPVRADVSAANGMRLDRIRYHRNSAAHLAEGIPEVVQKWRETFGV